MRIYTFSERRAGANIFADLPEDMDESRKGSLAKSFAL